MVDNIPEGIAVIVVDQSHESTESLDAALEGDDYTSITSVPNAAEGLEALSNCRPDCIVSAYDLPDTNGIDLLETIRDRHPALPFILYANDVERVAEAAIDAGATDCIRTEDLRTQPRAVAKRIENAVTTYRVQQGEDQHDAALDSFFHESPHGAVQWDDEFCCQRLNERAERILGRDEAAFRGRSWEEVVANDDQAHAGDAISNRLVADNETSVVTSSFRSNGESRTLEWHNRAVTDTEGNVQSVYSQVRDITDQANRSLELAEYETIIEALTDPVYVLDETGGFTFVNTEFAELVGYDRERIIGSDPSLIKDDEAIEQAESVLSQLLSSDGPETMTFEVTIHPRDGEPIVCEDHMGVLPYEGEKFDGSVGTLRDITELKEQQQELRTERDRFRAIFNDAFDAMVIVDDAGRYREVNEQATELFGLSERELVGHSIDEFTPAAMDVETLWQELQQQETDKDTVTLVRADGTERLVEYTVSTDIAPGQHLAILRDVTEHRRRERRFQALVEEANDIISIVDADGRFQYQSPSVERVLGYEPDETVGEKVWEYIHPADREHTLEQFEAWVENPEQVPKGIEYRAQHADGTWRWMEAYGSAQLDNPAVEGYLFTSRDVTERKERRQQMELVDRVLRHNVRNDMNVIRGKASIIHDNTTGEHAKYAKQIIETSDNLIDTAETERKMAKLLAESADPIALLVLPLLQQVAMGIRTKFPAATVTVDCPNDVTMQATPQFRQAIEELLTNAIFHNPDDAPVADVTVAEHAETVQIEIADTGPRIPEMEREVLVGNKKRTPLDHGSGLGLWFVQLLVSRSGGSIRFEENAPTGNIVILELPR